MQTDIIQKLLPSWIVNSSTYSVSVTDLDGKYLFVNQVFYNRFSFISQNFIGQPFEITMHKDDVDKANQAAI
ncbi:MAG: hypothetical protein ACOVLC_04455 [Flavobacterium sp.]